MGNRTDSLGRKRPFRKDNASNEEEEQQKRLTLAELLIVVAIIAVLTAIAIPVFSAQLEKSKEATDMANIRSAYAEVVAAWLSDNSAHTAEVPLKSNQKDWKGDSTTDVAGVNASTILSKDSTTPLTVSITTDGSVTIGGHAAKSGFESKTTT